MPKVHQLYARELSELSELFTFYFVLVVDYSTLQNIKYLPKHLEVTGKIPIFAAWNRKSHCNLNVLISGEWIAGTPLFRYGSPRYSTIIRTWAGVNDRVRPL